MDYSDYNTEEFNTKALDQKEIIHNLNFNSSKLNMVPADIDDDHDESEVRETVNSMTNDDSLVVLDENNIN